MLALNFQVLLGFLHHFPLEFLSFLLVFLSELLPQLDLVIEHLSYLLHLLHLNLLLLLQLLFVQFLSELLDLAPLIVANVRRHVLDLHFLSILLLADLDRMLSAQLGGHLSSSSLLLRIVLSWLRVKFSLVARGTCHDLIQVLHQRCASTRPALVLG